MPPDNESEMLLLLKEDTVLARENNRLLKKMRRSGIIGMWVRTLWYAALIGLPFALYFYILEPYFETFGSSYEQFRMGVGELPELKVLESFLETRQNGE